MNLPFTTVYNNEKCHCLYKQREKCKELGGMNWFYCYLDYTKQWFRCKFTSHNPCIEENQKTDSSQSGNTQNNSWDILSYQKVILLKISKRIYIYLTLKLHSSYIFLSFCIYVQFSASWSNPMSHNAKASTCLTLTPHVKTRISSCIKEVWKRRKTKRREATIPNPYHSNDVRINLCDHYNWYIQMKHLQF